MFSRQLGMLAIAVALALVVSAVSAQAQTDSGTPSPDDPCLAAQAADSPGSESTPGAEEHDMAMDIEFDLMFIDTMTPHHQEAADMAQVALNRSTNEEVRQLAEAIIAAQTAEIEQMAEWRVEWYPEAPQMSDDQTMQMMEDVGMMSMESGDMLAELCDEETVDVTFLELMIPHHESAIAMAEAALTEAEHDELRELAEVIVETQSAEITLMRDLLAGLTGTPTAQG